MTWLHTLAGNKELFYVSDAWKLVQKSIYDDF